jgi:hypothetical protein
VSKLKAVFHFLFLLSIHEHLSLHALAVGPQLMLKHSKDNKCCGLER